jgi:hypothetical protein
VRNGALEFCTNKTSGYRRVSGRKQRTSISWRVEALAEAASA